jgi:phage N-6-adenine-methyltransferase
VSEDHNAEVGHSVNSIDLFVSCESDEWATPPEFARPLAEAVAGFDLDPASGAEKSPVADQTYTEDDDGLSQTWYGAVWCNPPYSEMEAWTRKAINESNRPEVDAIFYLCKGDSSTDWWQSAVCEADALAMIDGRLWFGGRDAAPFCSHVFVFGDAPDESLDVLDRRGVVFRASEKVARTEQQDLVSATDGGTDCEVHTATDPPGGPGDK